MTLNLLTAAHRKVSWLLLSQEGNRKSQAALILFFSVFNGNIQWSIATHWRRFLSIPLVLAKTLTAVSIISIHKHKLTVLSLLFSLVIL